MMRTKAALASLSGVLLVLAVACAVGENDADNAAGWEVELSDLDAALTSVWGTSATDVWVTGSDPNAAGSLVMHFGGSEWETLPTGTTGDLWWAFGFEGGDVFFGGAGGLILRYSDGAFETMEAPGDAIVYGIWGPSEDDLWAVGGNAVSDAFAWRYDGESWREVEGFPPVLQRSASMFKVWGSGPEDVWLVGTGGAILHYDGDRLTQVDSATTRDLFTVTGAGGLVAAVGGFGTGVIVENTGNGWQDVTPDATPHVVGIWLGDDDGWAVGVEGAVLRRENGAWTAIETGIEVPGALHTVWVDPAGGVWSVGGEVLAPPLVDGVLIYKSPPDEGS